MNALTPFWWLVGSLGLGGAVLVLVGLVFGWPIIVGTKIGRMAILICSAGIAAVWFYLKARAEGAAAERQRQEAENAEFLERQARADAELHRLPDADLDELLTDHRDPGAGQAKR